MRTRDLAKEFAKTQISDGEWVDYFSVVKWVEDEAIRQLGIKVIYLVIGDST